MVLLAHGIEVWGKLSSSKQKMLNKCDAIFCVSQFTKNKLLDEQGLQNKNLFVLNNCLDPFMSRIDKRKEESLLKKYNLTSQHKVLLSLTRLSSKELYKGYDHVLKSVAELKKNVPEICYLLVGKYDDKEKKRLEIIVEQLGIKKQVIFAGFIPDEDLANHFALADVFVMPSKKEGFGIVFIEAMFYGLPVIAGNKDGSVDPLLNGQLGILVDPDNEQEITHQISNVLNNANKYLPDEALLLKHFSFDAYKQNLQLLFSELKH